MFFFFCETNTHTRKREIDFTTKTQTIYQHKGTNKRTHTKDLIKKKSLFKGKGYYKVYTLD